MKKISIIVAVGFVLFLAACGNEEASSNNGSKDNSKTEGEHVEKTAISKGTISMEDMDKIYSDPKKYKDYKVEFTGQVFVEPERDDDGVYLQVWADPENSEKNTIVGIEDPDFKVKTDDYVKVKGTIKDNYKGENAFGGTVSAPVVLADDIEIVDFITALSPTEKTIKVNETQDQHGFVVTLEKVELAKNMTRLYMKVKNNTKDSISFYSFDTKLIIDNKQLEEDDQFFDTGLPELQSELLPDAETEGVIVFPAIDEKTSNIKVHAEGSSDNYDLEIKPFEFEVGKK